MQRISLLSTTGIEQVDQSMRAIVEHLELHFPDRVRGYYLVGSFAVGEAIPTSDIDMIALFKGSPSDEERQRFEQAREECRRLSVRPIDLTLGTFCQQCLGFENHFLASYQTFLLAELEHPDEAIALAAARRLGQVIYRDTAVVAALQAAGQRGSEELRRAAAEALSWYTAA